MKSLFRRGATASAVMALLMTLGGPAAQAAPPVAPTIVLVHGAWADTSSWDAEINLLTGRGYAARAVANPLHDLAGDARAVASFLEAIDGPVVLVGHSYGGSVITQAAAGNPDVRALVYVDAFIPDIGESAGSLNGDGSILHALPEEQLFDTVQDGGATGLLLTTSAFQQHFASDLPPEQSARLWATQRTTATAAVGAPCTATAWRTIPSWAFISTGDQIITAQSKQAMATRAGATVTTFDGGSHVTLISHPDAVVSVIESAAASVT